MLGGPAPDEQAAQTPSPLGLESSFGDLGGDSSMPSALPFADPMAGDAFPPGAAVSGSALVPKEDFAAALPGLQASPRTFLGSVYSGYEADGTPSSPSDASVGLSDGVERPGDEPAFLPTALPPAGSGPLELPASSGDAGTSTGGSPTDIPTPATDQSSEHDDSIPGVEGQSPVRRSVSAGASAATGPEPAPRLMAIEVELADREQIIAGIVSNGAALAQTTAEAVVDARLSEFNSAECLRSAQRDACGSS